MHSGPHLQTNRQRDKLTNRHTEYKTDESRKMHSNICETETKDRQKDRRTDKLRKMHNGWNEKHADNILAETFRKGLAHHEVEENIENSYIALLNFFQLCK